MPLIKSGSKQAVSTNIREMMAAGHPQKQAVAAALSTARRYGKARGGYAGAGEVNRESNNAPVADTNDDATNARAGFNPLLPKVRAGDLPYLPPLAPPRPAAELSAGPPKSIHEYVQRSTPYDTPLDRAGDVARNVALGWPRQVGKASDAVARAIEDPSLSNIAGVGTQTGMALGSPMITFPSLALQYADALRKDLGSPATEAAAQTELRPSQQRRIEIQKQLQQNESEIRQRERDAESARKLEEDRKLKEQGEYQAELDRANANLQAALTEAHSPAKNRTFADTAVGKTWNETGGFAPFLAGAGSGFTQRAINPLVGHGRVMGLGALAGAGAANTPLLADAYWTPPVINPEKKPWMDYARDLPPAYPRKSEFQTYAGLVPEANPVRTEAAKNFKDPLQFLERTASGAGEGVLGSELGYGLYHWPARLWAARPWGPGAGGGRGPGPGPNLGGPSSGGPNAPLGGPETGEPPPIRLQSQEGTPPQPANRLLENMQKGREAVGEPTPTAEPAKPTVQEAKPQPVPEPAPSPTPAVTTPEAPAGAPPKPTTKLPAGYSYRWNPSGKGHWQPAHDGDGTWGVKPKDSKPATKKQSNVPEKEALPPENPDYWKDKNIKGMSGGGHSGEHRRDAVMKAKSYAAGGMPNMPAGPGTIPPMPMGGLGAMGGMGQSRGMGKMGKIGPPGQARPLVTPTVPPPQKRMGMALGGGGGPSIGGSFGPGAPSIGQSNTPAMGFSGVPSTSMQTDAGPMTGSSTPTPAPASDPAHYLMGLAPPGPLPNGGIGATALPTQNGRGGNMMPTGDVPTNVGMTGGVNPLGIGYTPNWWQATQAAPAPAGAAAPTPTPSLQTPTPTTPTQVANLPQNWWAHASNQQPPWVNATLGAGSGIPPANLPTINGTPFQYSGPTGLGWSGGVTGSSGVGPPSYAAGGRAPRGPSGAPMHVGSVRGPTGGRDDAKAVDVPGGSYIIPAETVSHLGGSNTEAGLDKLEKFFGQSKYKGFKSVHAAAGGSHSAVPIQISDGEFAVPPEVVTRIGNGDIEQGHRVLDALIMRLRQQHIDTLKKLPPPSKA